MRRMHSTGGADGLGGLLGTRGAARAAGPLPTVPLTVNQAENIPHANISVGGGRSTPVSVDTGSTGLVIPVKDVGVAKLGVPTGSGAVTYGDGTS
jgi:hypothetical protein